VTTRTLSPDPQASAAVPASRGKTRTLWWLLGVLVIGLLLAVGVAVGIRWWQRISRNELRAVGSCRAYCSFQTMCKRGDWDGPEIPIYIRPYSKLAGKGPFHNALISMEFAKAQGSDGVPYYGYLFDDLKTIGGKPIDLETDYGLCATPARYGLTGLRTFVVSTDGTVWGKDLGKSEFLTDMPTNPKAAGWRIAE
jgi:Protein of unknown function (DUF2950)